MRSLPPLRALFAMPGGRRLAERMGAAARIRTTPRTSLGNSARPTPNGIDVPLVTATTIHWMRTASEFVPAATSGNSTAIDIAAPPKVVWRAIEELCLDDLRVARLLMGVRSLPARALKGGALRSARRAPVTPLIEAMVGGRFTVLCREPDTILTLGIVGQFWKLSGGEDAGVDSAAAFVAFDQRGFVKSAIDFELQRTERGTRVATRTRNQATDYATARRFRRYWLLIGPGSKAIRLDILHAVRRRAESVQTGSHQTSHDELADPRRRPQR
jgi:hypothetical protein